MIDIIWLLTLLLLIIGVGLMAQAIKRMQQLEKKIEHIEQHIDEIAHHKGIAKAIRQVYR